MGLECLAVNSMKRLHLNSGMFRTQSLCVFPVYSANAKVQRWPAHCTRHTKVTFLESIRLLYSC